MLFGAAPPKGFITRFAPAPTGYLHLGHVASAVAVWGAARAFGGRVLLRIEDHDRVRSRPEYEIAILEDLRWLGLEPDEPFVRQSERVALYQASLDDLETRGLTYPCVCSRKAFDADGAADGERRYPGTCRTAAIDSAAVPTRRVRFERLSIQFGDLRLGPVEQIPSEQCGDLLVRDRLSQWTYQFAVTVDDFHQGIGLVVRGEDLLASTGRQIQLSRLLRRTHPPQFLHHPLILRGDGQKLSKSNQDTGLRELRAAGWTVERILGAATAALGLAGGEPISFNEAVALIKGSRP